MSNIFFRRSWIVVLLLSSLLASFPGSRADQYITYTGSNNQVLHLDDNRKPALYTQTFGSCLPSSEASITIDRFDGALYTDNMTMVFHITGNTQLTSNNVMVYLEVYAYGESRFAMAWNPCGTGITSLCPIKSSVPIKAGGIIPLSQQDIANIPRSAYHIPDFEGQAILRIFSDTTQTEIACYAAAITNGATFNQRESVSVVLGVFALVALISSLATAVYGQSVLEMRNRYANSLSMLVVFAVYHHIYFTGALSMNWPSVLVAFWSNYAWAAGMIPIPSMQKAISKFTGDQGDTMNVGAAKTGGNSSSVAGGYDIHNIYRRQSNTPILMGRLTQPVKWISSVDFLSKRDLPSTATGYKWYGPEVRAGLPLPGNFSGFAGTLSEEGIPASNAFITGLIWFVIFLLAMAVLITILKLWVEFDAQRNEAKAERFEVFKANWKRYILFSTLRGCYISFFMISFLSIFQFTYNGRPGVIAVAALIFAIFFLGVLGIAGYACYVRLRFGTWSIEADRIVFKKTTVMRILPWYAPCLANKIQESENYLSFSIPFLRIQYLPTDDEIPVHEDVNYILKFGWLVSRFRSSRWWFFAAYLIYELMRACFFAGASGHPLVQVFCLLVVEFGAFIVFATFRPLEGQRLNNVMVYFLGFSKVLTVALSAAFDVTFNISRASAGIIGITIIAIQLLLTLALMVCIVLSAISSYSSITRQTATNKLEPWIPWRKKYSTQTKHTATVSPLEKESTDVTEAESTEKTATAISFSVNSVKRLAKIEDEDSEFQRDIAVDPRSPFEENPSELGLLTPGYFPPSTGLLDIKAVSRRTSVAHSLRSNTSRSSLPYAAMLHRGSWTTRDFAEYQAERNPVVDRVRHSGHFSTSNSETALSPQLQHLSSRDNLTEIDGEVLSKETGLASKRSSRTFSPTQLEKEISGTHSSSSNATSGSTESTNGLNAQARTKSRLTVVDLVETKPSMSPS